MLASDIKETASVFSNQQARALLSQAHAYSYLDYGNIGAINNRIKKSDHSHLCLFFFLQYRHLATPQGRVGRRDQAGDIKCLWSCLRPVISSQQSLSPFDPLTPLSPSPTPPIRPIHLITTETKLSIRHILRSLEIVTPHIREPKINLPSIRIV